MPAAIRFVSAEPFLGPIDFRPRLAGGEVNWIITGCEKARWDLPRAMDLDWVRDIDSQCTAAGVPHFFKQCSIGNQIRKDGLLDGQIRQEFPTRS